MSAATPFNLARSKILDRFQVRIDRGDQKKLTREECENLAVILVDKLMELNQRDRKTSAGVELFVGRGEGATQVLHQSYYREAISS